MILSDIIDYWGFGRARGHTHAMVHGLFSDEATDCIVIMGNHSQKKMLERELREKGCKRKHKLMVISDTADKLMGLSLPLIVDHYAMAILVKDDIDRLMKMANMGNWEYD